MSIARMRQLALPILGAVAAAPAAAASNDALQVYGGVAYGHDDNLLRLPDHQLGVDGRRGDAWWTREGGLLFDRSYGRQRLSLVAKLSKTSFAHFKRLDYDGKDLQANWAWQLGKHLEGRVGATLQQVLAPYTDFSSAERNLRRIRSSYAEGAWRLHPAWRARAGFQRDRYTYEALGNRYNNRTEDAAEFEIDYLPRSGSRLGLVARRVKGRYSFPRPAGPFRFDDDFTQDELKARVRWLASGTTTLDALAGYTRRQQFSYGEGRTSGVAGRIDATWQPRGKTVYRIALWRDFAPLESSVVSHTRNTGARAAVHWDASAAIALDADATLERRNYGARRAFAGAAGLHDALRTATLRATWHPRPRMQVQGGLAHQARSGSAALGTGSVGANSATLSANLQF